MKRAERTEHSMKGHVEHRVAEGAGDEQRRVAMTAELTWAFGRLASLR